MGRRKSILGNMEIKETKIKGVFIIHLTPHKDSRGEFIKVFNKEIFSSYGIDFTPQESFYSISKKGAIRGMHFQIPPQDSAKIVYSPKGKILDVIVDLRKDSETYGTYISTELSEDNHLAIYIPKGCAHGFQALEDDSHSVYLQEKVYSKEHDTGINPQSFGFEWPIQESTLSDRDKSFISLKNFSSPF